MQQPTVVLVESQSHWASTGTNTPWEGTVALYSVQRLNSRPHLHPYCTNIEQESGPR